MSTNGETTPLLNSGSGDNNYYFLNAEGKAPGVVGDQEVEELPPGATEEDFQPRVLGARGKVCYSLSQNAVLQIQVCDICSLTFCLFAYTQ